MALDWGAIAQGAAKGAGTGAGVGSVIPGVGTAIGTAAGGVLGALGSALTGRSNPQETEMQQKQRQLVDQLISSLNGEGPFSDLFSRNEDTFNKNFAEPARQRFKNQIAPQIQQSYIASGQQRGTGLQDSLTRSGVDIDQLINSEYMNYINQGNQNKFSAINSILGSGPGVAQPQSYGEAALQGAGGYLTSNRFSSDIDNILNAWNNRPKKVVNRPGEQKEYNLPDQTSGVLP